MQNYSVKFKSGYSVDGLGDFGFGRGESLIFMIEFDGNWGFGGNPQKKSPKNVTFT